MVWYGMVWYGMVWYGMVWYGMVWYGMVWYGMVDVCEGTHRCRLAATHGIHPPNGKAHLHRAEEPPPHKMKQNTSKAKYDGMMASNRGVLGVEHAEEGACRVPEPVDETPSRAPERTVEQCNTRSQMEPTGSVSTNSSSDGVHRQFQSSTIKHTNVCAYTRSRCTNESHGFCQHSTNNQTNNCKRQLQERFIAVNWKRLRRATRLRWRSTRLRRATRLR